MNKRPPDDYNAYYSYIKAIADALKNRFGISEVKTWNWSVMKEFDNPSWFEAADGTAASSKIEFFKLYDYM